MNTTRVIGGQKQAGDLPRAVDKFNIAKSVIGVWI